MTTALVYFSASLGVLLILSILYIAEDVRGKRIVLSRPRLVLDGIFGALWRFFSGLVWSLWHGVSQFVLRYGVHRLLGAMVAYLRSLEKKVEEHVVHYRHQHNSAEKTNRTHLDEIAEHKESTALSEEEKRRLKRD